MAQDPLEVKNQQQAANLVSGKDQLANKGSDAGDYIAGTVTQRTPAADPVLSGRQVENGANYNTIATNNVGILGVSDAGDYIAGTVSNPDLANNNTTTYRPSGNGGGGGGSSTPAYNPYAADATHGTATSGIQLQGYTADTDRINELYGQRQDAQLLALQNAYNASRASAEQSMQDIPQSYIEASNAAEARAMQNQRAFNEAASANGLNVGTGAQAQLAQTNALQNELSSIRAQQANAQAQAQFNLQQLEQNYQNSVAEAIANNEFQKASALMDAYEKERQSAIDTANKQAQLDQAAMETRAANLAQYGDFSAYAELGYSADEIKAMFNAWKAANPKLYKAIYGGGSGGGFNMYTSSYAQEVRDALAQNNTAQDVKDYIASNADAYGNNNAQWMMQYVDMLNK